MINSLKFYFNLGCQTGKAQSRNDAALVRANNEYLTHALSREKPEDRNAAREEFNRGYREETHKW